MSKIEILASLLFVILVLVASALMYTLTSKDVLTEEQCVSNNGVIKVDGAGHKFCEFRSGAWITLA